MLARSWSAGLVAVMVAVTSCSSGGGGGTSEEGSLRLSEAFFGRGLRTAQQLQAVSPLTLVAQDPLTGFDIPATLEPLVQGGDTQSTVSLELGADYEPRVIPRNAVLVLRFTQDLDPTSVEADRLADDGTVLEGGSIQIRDATGRGVPVRLRVNGSRVLVDPLVGDRVGFPASPFCYDTKGKILADPQGVVKLILPTSGNAILRSKGGKALERRTDELGTAAFPIELNPGNEGLDFIAENELGDFDETFNGFLPDLEPPRIIRRYVVEAELTSGDSVAANSLFIASASFDVRANNGFGEWAGARLIIRPGESDEEEHTVDYNNTKRITLKEAFQEPPVKGDLWRLERAEYFEPDPENPIDPELFDPWNPQNDANREIANFVFFDEIDASGKIADVNGDGKTRYAATETVPSRSLLSMRFNEPIDVASALPYESFRVRDEVGGGVAAGEDRVGVVQASEGGRIITFSPARLLESAGSEYAGFGTEDGGKRLFSTITVPGLEFLQQKLPPQDIDEFLTRGIRPVRDLGGQPLAYAVTEFDRDTIFIERTVSFTIATSPGEDYADWGAVVHKFQGTPSVESDPERGVKFHDQTGLYDEVPDINVKVKSRLAGAPVTYAQRVLDDQSSNRPPGDPYTKNSQGATTPLNGIYGARFQHIFRRDEASISRTGDLARTLQDLYRVSFAPIGGHVSGPDVYEDVSLHAAHSAVVPNTHHNPVTGLPDEPNSGLGLAFDPESFATGFCGPSEQVLANYEGTLATVVSPGTRWTVEEASIYTIAASPHPYHPWPSFAKRFQYDNDHSLLLEYRIRPQVTSVSLRNGFTFSQASTFDFYPRFRVFSLGDASNTLDPDPGAPADNRAYCASGPLNPGDFGDNSRYFYAFDYVKTTSVVISPFVEAPGNGARLTGPRWLDPMIEPPLETLLPGTTVLLELRATDDPPALEGYPEEGWTTDPNELAGRFIQFRLRIVVDPDTLLTPSFETIVLPFER
ncbi:MAG: hypothetical protein AB1486_02265 [Planctomycetota bacterium]